MNGARWARTILSLVFLLLSTSFCCAALNASQNNQLGVEAYRVGDTARALDYLRQARQDQPYDEQIRKNLAVVLLARGHELLRQGRYRQAGALFHQGQELAPDDTRFLLARAHALMAEKAYAEAEVVLNEALGIDDQQAGVWQLLGRVDYLTNRLEKAIDAWRRALELDPGNTSLQAMLAKARREAQVESGMEQSYTSSFVLSYDAAGDPDLGAELLDVLHQAYVELGGNLDVYPARQIPVLIYTRADFSRITASPDWAAGLYDGKIRIPLGGVKQVSAPLQAVLFHEYTHVVVRELAGNRCPTWLNEGLAELAGRGRFNPPLRTLEQAPALLDFNSLTGSWKNLPAAEIRLAYEQSYSFVRYLVNDYGWFQIGDILRDLGAGAPADDAFARVFGSYGLSLAELQQQWKQDLGR
ncbi:hypothetical protein C2E25_13220 [Geothermobacter hydrogeniphilus]|uniref:Peptidase MA-like domain-containing protein n=1 Tax=Geothermobacter hydrogeniphilus TaxID=1969733 RepID=A0A2K2H7R8_9BACT|nr:tetratricopeptide repeat protein [Geothermobacter hydrogeniphilus]PNU19299.1 hypothetical protein C2E25_13220 [Geothermobacter hydrogeniphilus]